MHRSEIPNVTTREVSGTSLDTLVIDYGGARHRSHEGFVIGQVSDFDESLAECEQVP
uniref:Uncharacterized protein n=1 Tax=uncultured bacterium A1Q1_fos_91 TaxID=1256591 RepID=L7VWP3_9BACT|nr:hypothetical protein [uncultured bacterium A1Q1_fos_91]